MTHENDPQTDNLKASPEVVRAVIHRTKNSFLFRGKTHSAVESEDGLKVTAKPAEFLSRRHSRELIATLGAAGVTGFNLAETRENGVREVIATPLNENGVPVEDVAALSLVDHRMNAELPGILPRVVEIPPTVVFLEDKVSFH